MTDGTVGTSGEQTSTVEADETSDAHATNESMGNGVEVEAARVSPCPVGQ